MHPEGRTADVVMLGFAGMRVLDARDVNGELELLIQTTAVRDWCRGCGVRAHAHGRPEVLVRDVDGFGRRVRLRWRKRRWRCRETVCATSTWTETQKGSRPRAVPQEACRRVGKCGESVAAVARDLGVGWHIVMTAVWVYGQPLVDDPARLDDVAMLGMDETAWLRANRWHHTF